MKIAIIGCSFSAYQIKTHLENNWAHQLYQKFPQHTYYVYAKGGRSIDYFQWCLLDAKMNNVDFVFMNRTFSWRVGALADATFDDSLNKFFFREREMDKNFYFRYNNSIKENIDKINQKNYFGKKILIFR